MYAFVHVCSMARFSCEEELAQFLKALDDEYQQYAHKLWNDGHVRSAYMLANAREDHLRELDIPPIHADDIKARAGEQNCV